MVHSHALTLSLSALLLSTLSSATVKFEKRQSQYPTPDVKGPTPKQEWIDTYNAAKAAGKIPSWPVATLVNGVPQYPAGTQTGVNGVCSWTATKCTGVYDVVDAPANIWSIAFDDGPQLASPGLYDFLKSKNVTATHFMIGSRILDNPGIFGQALDQGEHIAIHTWSHPYMTTMTDMQVLGELGWTAQIIYDYSGFVPAFWRPPYGDMDNRVRAIAREVFGLYNVAWNGDTFDWCLGENNVDNCPTAGPHTDAGLDAELQTFITGAKNPGRILLEHELTTRSIGGFERNFPSLFTNGWTPKNIPDIWSVDFYLNGARTIGGPDGNNVTIGSGPNPYEEGKYQNSNATTNSTSTTTSASTTVVVPTPTQIGQSFSVQTITETGSGSAVSTATADAAKASASKTSSAHSNKAAFGLVAGMAAILALVVV